MSYFRWLKTSIIHCTTPVYGPKLSPSTPRYRTLERRGGPTLSYWERKYVSQTQRHLDLPFYCLHLCLPHLVEIIVTETLIRKGRRQKGKRQNVVHPPASSKVFSSRVLGVSGSRFSCWNDYRPTSKDTRNCVHTSNIKRHTLTNVKELIHLVTENGSWEVRDFETRPREGNHLE